ncbi:MAG: tRNA (adenosine(37)-N6)-threonylcarbamoyltransferase complex dimerization subunit type 1 TsaB [Woeseia sp.]
MKLLALDTSTTACSVALQYDETILERHVVQAKEHTRLLIPMIREVLAEAGVSLPTLDAIVLGNGPGSFIGMRISASVAQGLAFGSRLPIVPVSSLAAIAAEAFLDPEVANVLVAQDAHMDEVYLARFKRSPHGLPLAEGDTVLQPISRLAVAELGIGRWHAAGRGWTRYPELLRLNEDCISGPIEPEFPRARFLLETGAAAFAQGKAIDAGQLSPFYVRSRVAARPRRQEPLQPPPDS